MHVHLLPHEIYRNLNFKCPRFLMEIGDNKVNSIMPKYEKRE